MKSDRPKYNQLEMEKDITEYNQIKQNVTGQNWIDLKNTGQKSIELDRIKVERTEYNQI